MESSVLVGHHKYRVSVSETEEKDGFVVSIPVAGVKKHVKEFHEWRQVARERIADHNSRTATRNEL